MAQRSKTMSNSNLIKKMTGTAILIAIIVVFQFIGNNINISGVSFNLSLLPVTIGAFIYGPLVGGFLGLVTGIMVLPGAGAFMAYNVFFTLLVCLTKTTIAGFVSGLLFNLLKKKNLVVAAFVASMVVPIINSGIFAIGCFTIFKGMLLPYASSPDTYVGYVFLVLIGVNFLFELIVAITLTPSTLFVLKTVLKSSPSINNLYNKKEDGIH